MHHRELKAVFLAEICQRASALTPFDPTKCLLISPFSKNTTTSSADIECWINVMDAFMQLLPL